LAAEESDRFPAPTTDVVDAQRREAKLCSTRSSCLRKSSIWRSRSRRQRPEIKGRQVSDERWENRARRPKRGVICLVSAKYKRRHKTKRPTHSVFKLTLCHCSSNSCTFSLRQKISSKKRRRRIVSNNIRSSGRLKSRSSYANTSVKAESKVADKGRQQGQSLFVKNDRGGRSF